MFVGDGGEHRLGRYRQPDTDGADDRGVSESEPEPYRDRAFSLVHEFAGGVVDRGDVVCVERVSHPQRVGRDRDADAEQLEVLGHHQEHEHAPSEDGEHQDDQAHPGQAAPLRRIHVPQRLAEAGLPRGRVRLRHGRTFR